MLTRKRYVSDRYSNESREKKISYVQFFPFT